MTKKNTLLPLRGIKEIENRLLIEFGHSDEGTPVWGSERERLIVARALNLADTHHKKENELMLKGLKTIENQTIGVLEKEISRLEAEKTPTLSDILETIKTKIHDLPEHRDYMGRIDKKTVLNLLNKKFKSENLTERIMELEKEVCPLREQVVDQREKISRLKVIKQNELNKAFGTGYTQGVEEKEAKFRKLLEELKEWNCYCKTCGKHGPAATEICFKKNHLILIPWNDIEEHFAKILKPEKEVRK